MSTELVDYTAQMAAIAAQYAEAETVGGSFLTTSGGMLQLGGEPLLGNQVCAVIIDSVRENTYYADKYVPDHRAAPRCYAFGRSDDDMAPHPGMQADMGYFSPQHETCKGCPRNEWGSADQGKGKACQNRRRLALLPAGYYVAKPNSRDFDLHLFTDPEHFRGADMAFLKLPVTSVREYGKYVQTLAAQRRPPFGVVTRLYAEPDPKSQYKIKFEMVDLLPDDILAAVFPRHQAAGTALMTPYSAPSDED
jgi:hypothetical protein